MSETAQTTDLPETLWLLRVTQGPGGGGGWTPGNWVRTINGLSLDFVGAPFVSPLGPPTPYTKGTAAGAAAMVRHRYRVEVDFVPFREVRL